MLPQRKNSLLLVTAIKIYVLLLQTKILNEKFVLLTYMPSCFPTGSSNWTPTQNPGASVSAWPTNLTVPLLSPGSTSHLSPICFHEENKMVFKQVNNNTKLLLFWARKSKLEERKIKKEVLRRTQLLHHHYKKKGREKQKGKGEILTNLTIKAPIQAYWDLRLWRLGSKDSWLSPYINHNRTTSPP